VLALAAPVAALRPARCARGPLSVASPAGVGVRLRRAYRCLWCAASLSPSSRDFGQGAGWSPARRSDADEFFPLAMRRPLPPLVGELPRRFLAVGRASLRGYRSGLECCSASCGYASEKASRKATGVLGDRCMRESGFPPLATKARLRRHAVNPGGARHLTLQALSRPHGSIRRSDHAACDRDRHHHPDRPATTLVFLWLRPVHLLLPRPSLICLNLVGVLHLRHRSPSSLSPGWRSSTPPVLRSRFRSSGLPLAPICKKDRSRNANTSRDALSRRYFEEIAGGARGTRPSRTRLPLISG